MGAIDIQNVNIHRILKEQNKKIIGLIFMNNFIKYRMGVKTCLGKKI